MEFRSQSKMWAPLVVAVDESREVLGDLVSTFESHGTSVWKRSGGCTAWGYSGSITDQLGNPC